jgi:hypothetical protein
MSFAPYTNDRRGELPPVMGAFRHAETGCHFEFAGRDDADRETFAPEAPFRVFVGMGETRAARVLKTVAWVVVDEAADGSPVYERWPLRQFRPYALAE